MISRARTVVAAAIAAVATCSAATADLSIYYEEDFCLGLEPECFDSGFGLEGQHGWSAIPGQTILGHTDGRIRRTGFRADSRGAGFGFERICQSPKFGDFPQATGEDFVVSVMCGFTHARTTWYITPENRSTSRIATRIRFASDGTIAVLIPDGQGGGTFTQIEGISWEPRTGYSITMVFHDDGRFQLGINNREVALLESPAFAIGIEAIAFETGNERVDQGILVDRIKTWRGNIR